MVKLLNSFTAPKAGQTTLAKGVTQPLRYVESPTYQNGMGYNGGTSSITSRNAMYAYNEDTKMDILHRTGKMTMMR